MQSQAGITKLPGRTTLFLVCLFIVAAPMEWFAFAQGGNHILQGSWIICGIIGSSFILSLIAGEWRVPRSALTAITPFLFFVLVGAIALVASPYFGSALGKGLTQIAGLFGVLTVTLAAATLVSGRFEVLSKLVTCTAVVGGILGGVGIVQFVVNNLAGTQAIDFGWLGGIWGQWSTYGASAGLVGGLWRPSSLASEPAHMTTFLAPASGLALVRVGALGRGAAVSLARYVPAWAAFSIIGGIAVSISLIGYSILAAALIATLLLGKVNRVRSRQARRRSPWLLGGAAMVAAITIAVPLAAQKGLVDKASSVSLVIDAFGPQEADLGRVSMIDISGAILAANVTVTISNLSARPLLGVGLGAYPISYDALVPDAFFQSDLFGLNRNGEGSLLLRLLSETGVLGTIAFLWACGSLVQKTRRLSRVWLASAANDERMETAAYLGFAITASCAATVYAYLARYGAYYDACLWQAIALAVSLLTLSPRPVRQEELRASAAGAESNMGSAFEELRSR